MSLTGSIGIGLIVISIFTTFKMYQENPLNQKPTAELLFFNLKNNSKNIKQILSQSLIWKSIEFGSCGSLVRTNGRLSQNLSYKDPQGQLIEVAPHEGSVEHSLDTIRFIIDQSATANPNCNQMDVVIEEDQKFVIIKMTINSKLIIETIDKISVPK